LPPRPEDPLHFHLYLVTSKYHLLSSKSRRFVGLGRVASNQEDLFICRPSQPHSRFARNPATFLKFEISESALNLLPIVPTGPLSSRALTLWRSAVNIGRPRQSGATAIHNNPRRLLANPLATPGASIIAER
jgi:hypothetical protein